MNAPYDFSLLNAVKKVGAVLDKNPGGLQISQLTGVSTMLMIEHTERLYEAYEKPAHPPAPALLQQFAKVLSGEYLIVPAQPSAAMISAGNSCNSLLDDFELQTRNIYQAMLDVAKEELNV